MILPAFGALTGGMDAKAPEIRSALEPFKSNLRSFECKRKAGPISTLTQGSLALAFLFLYHYIAYPRQNQAITGDNT